MNEEFNKFEIKKSPDFKYSIDVDYDIIHGVEDYGRGDRISVKGIEEDSFHPGHIYDKYVESIIYPGKKDAKKLLTPIQEYCIDRILAIHGAYNIENYDIGVTDGYYGEEIDSVKVMGTHKIEEEIVRTINTEKDVDKILRVLNLEYSKILPRIQDVKSVTIVNTNLEMLTRNSVEFTRIKNSEFFVKNGLGYNYPIGVLHEGIIIDGHNRTKRAISDGIVNAYYIELLQ